MKRRAVGAAATAAFLAAAPPGAAAGKPGGQPETGPLAVEVRVFEVRRLNSDFSPLEDLSFRIDSDGTSVQVSEWLATLARRIPDAYFAQLLTLGPAPADSEARWEVRRRGGRRTVRTRVRPAGNDDRATAAPGTEGGAPRAAPGFALEFDLLRSGTPAQSIRVRGPVEPGMTRMVSGRDFEITLSRYLSWFREPGDLAAREELYENIRNQNIYLAFGITFRRPEAEAPPPIRLQPPADPQLAALRTPLIGNADGTLRLRVHLDDAGEVAHTEILETTLPEVTPRVLGIVSGWQFPQAAGREGRLFFPVRSVLPIPSSQGAPGAR
jgi:hypothetical protein